LPYEDKKFPEVFENEKKQSTRCCMCCLVPLLVCVSWHHGGGKVIAPFTSLQKVCTILSTLHHVVWHCAATSIVALSPTLTSEGVVVHQGAVRCKGAFSSWWREGYCTIHLPPQGAPNFVNAALFRVALHPHFHCCTATYLA